MEKGVVAEEFPVSDSLPMIEAKRQRTQWFYNASWGLWSHYLGRSAGQGCIQTCINGTDDWQRRIDRFNVTKTAEQLASVGARYFFITIGQNSGYYISPNKAYDQVLGRAPAASRLSSRCENGVLLSTFYIIKMIVFTKTDSGNTSGKLQQEHCLSSDLVSDLADALAAQQPPIRLLVYLPAGIRQQRSCFCSFLSYEQRSIYQHRLGTQT